MRVLVTGVAGHIGSRLAQALEGEPSVNEVIGLDLKAPSAQGSKLRFLQHDVSAPFPAAMAEAGIDAAVHLAFVLDPGHDEARIRRVNIEGTRSFLAFCEAARVAHILYLSSTAVYGARPDNPPLLTEEMHPRPREGPSHCVGALALRLRSGQARAGWVSKEDYFYSRDKATSEAMLNGYAARHPEATVTILRACPVLGPATGNAIAYLSRQPLLPRVAGHDPPMQFLHEEDLVAALLLCLAKRPAGVYNLAGEGAMPYSEVARILGKRTAPVPFWLLYPLVGLLWGLRLADGPPSGLAFIRYPWVAATDKLAREVGFTPRYSSREALLAFARERGSAKVGESVVDTL